MKSRLFFAFSILMSFQLSAQNQVWHTFMDTVTSFSSPRSLDLNGDGILDIVLGGGIDGSPHANGIMAFNGLDGSLLWKRATHNEMFVSANFQDINNDGIPDVFIGGRDAQFYALDGTNGQQIWEFYPHPWTVNPNTVGLWNFYSPQFIPDMNSDGLQDLLVANGGDHSLPLWETNRPPGHLMVLNAANGGVLAKAVVPDSAETYCSPLVLDLKNDGNLWVLYGTGGESLGGNFYAALLSDLMNENLSNSVVLASHPSRGFIAPPSVHKSLTHAGYDIVVQGFGGQIYKFNGQTFAQEWVAHIPGTESSAQPVLGNFTGGDHIPDVFAVLYKGNMTSYTDYYQVMIDGSNGQIMFQDSIGTLHFPSGNAVDLNNDGRDEAIASITFHQNGYFHHKLMSFDFQNNTISQIHENKAGTNLGCTPLIQDLDDNGLLDIVYVVRKDSLNPVGLKGINVYRYELTVEIPNSGVAWGSYLGGNYDGVYNYTPSDCGFESVVAFGQVNSPSCNGLSNGSIIIALNNPSEPHTYLWSDGSVQPILTNIPAGTYSVRVTNASGCYEDRVFVCSDPYIISVGGILAPTCPGGSNGMATFSSTGCPCMFNTCVFTWSDGTVGSNNAQLSSGWNTISILHPDGCVVQDSVFIPEGQSAVNQQIVNNTTCLDTNDGSIALSSIPQFQAQFSWNTGENTSSINGLAAGEYTVTITDNRPCVETISFNILSPEEISFTAQLTHNNCHGEELGNISITAQGGTPDYFYVVDGTTYSDALVDNLAAGLYEIKIVDVNGCLSETVTVEITQPEEISIDYQVTIETSSGANDGSVNATVSGGNAPYNMQWTNANNQDIPNANNLGGGVYTLTVTDANGCVSQIEIRVETLSLSEQDWAAVLLYPNPISTGSSTNFLTIEAEGFKQYVLTSVNGQIIDQGLTKTVNIANLSAGIYLVKIECAAGLVEKKLVVVR